MKAKQVGTQRKLVDSILNDLARLAADALSMIWKDQASSLRLLNDSALANWYVFRIRQTERAFRFKSLTEAQSGALADLSICAHELLRRSEIKKKASLKSKLKKERAK